MGEDGNKYVVRSLERATRLMTFADLATCSMGLLFGVGMGASIAFHDGPRGGLDTPAFKSLEALPAWYYGYGGLLIVAGLLAVYATWQGCLFSTRLAMGAMAVIYLFQVAGYVLSIAYDGGNWRAVFLYLGVASIAILIAYFAADKNMG